MMRLQTQTQTIFFLIFLCHLLMVPNVFSHDDHDDDHDDDQNKENFLRLFGPLADFVEDMIDMGAGGIVILAFIGIGFIFIGLMCFYGCLILCCTKCCKQLDDGQQNLNPILVGDYEIKGNATSINYVEDTTPTNKDMKGNSPLIKENSKKEKNLLAQVDFF